MTGPGAAGRGAGADGRGELPGGVPLRPGGPGQRCRPAGGRRAGGRRGGGRRRRRPVGTNRDAGAGHRSGGLAGGEAGLGSAAAASDAAQRGRGDGPRRRHAAPERADTGDRGRRGAAHGRPRLRGRGVRVAVGQGAVVGDGSGAASGRQPRRVGQCELRRGGSRGRVRQRVRTAARGRWRLAELQQLGLPGRQWRRGGGPGGGDAGAGRGDPSAGRGAALRLPGGVGSRRRGVDPGDERERVGDDRRVGCGLEVLRQLGRRERGRRRPGGAGGRRIHRLRPGVAGGGDGRRPDGLQQRRGGLRRPGHGLRARGDLDLRPAAGRRRGVGAGGGPARRGDGAAGPGQRWGDGGGGVGVGPVGDGGVGSAAAVAGRMDGARGRDGDGAGGLRGGGARRDGPGSAGGRCGRDGRGKLPGRISLRPGRPGQRCRSAGGRRAGGRRGGGRRRRRPVGSDRDAAPGHRSGGLAGGEAGLGPAAAASDVAQRGRGDGPRRRHAAPERADTGDRGRRGAAHGRPRLRGRGVRVAVGQGAVVGDGCGAASGRQPRRVGQCELRRGGSRGRVRQRVRTAARGRWRLAELQQLGLPGRQWRRGGGPGGGDAGAGRGDPSAGRGAALRLPGGVGSRRLGVDPGDERERGRGRSTCRGRTRGTAAARTT